MWPFSPDLRQNPLLHFGQTYFFIFSCTHWICNLKECLSLNPLLQIWQTCGFKFLCTPSICILILYFEEKLLEQMLHWLGLRFSWTAIMWSFKLFDWSKLFLQIWHSNFVLCWWTVLMWRFKLEIQLNILLHDSHLGNHDFWDLAPVNSSQSNRFIASVLILFCFFFLWKYFMWIIKHWKFINFLEHFRHLCNLCLSNEHRPCLIINECLIKNLFE